jgi:hypothetical protein
MVRVREYLRPQFEDADALDIIVRVYSNLEGMANYLVKIDKVRNLGQLRAFSTGFCGRMSSFDWVDTGVGKEGGAGRKVRGKDLYQYLIDTHSLLRSRKSLLLHSQLAPPTRHRRLLTRRPPCIPHEHPSPRQTHPNRVLPPPTRNYRASSQNHAIRNHFRPTTTSQEPEIK